MKKWKIIVIAVAAAILIGGGITAYALLPHSLNYDIGSIQNIGSSIEIVSAKEDCVVIRNTEDRDFRIAAFTDMHLDGKNKTSYLTVFNLINNIITEKPDLVILGGDNVTSAFNRKRAEQLGEIFEKLGIYWAPVLGNHEGDNSYSVTRTEIVEIFSSYPHCLMLEGPSDIWGDGNYSVEILNSDNSLCRKFVFMDTGDEADSTTKAEYGIPEEDDPDDGVKKNQVEWYKKTIESAKDKYGEVKSSVIIHIPLPQYEEGFESAELLFGEKLENICESGFDSGLFDAIKSEGSTDSVFCGHDHLNTFGFLYDGVLLSYLQPSGYGSYTAASRLGYEEKDWLQGYVSMTLSKDGNITQEHHRNSENMQED